MSDSPAPVLILGAGVNGISVARELVLNGVPVWMVDTNDIAFGATAKSSRLIHGGLRYLEYGDFRLVAESLHERDRLLRLAPQFVTPLRLHIPVRRRLGGFIAAGLRFLGMSRTRLGKWIGSSSGRGLITVRFGLWFYDLLARSKMVPRHSVHRTGESGPPFPMGEYPWSCAYFDAQMERPERFCVALLRDIEETAKAQGTEFRLMTYHRAVLATGRVGFRPRVAAAAAAEWVKTHATEGERIEIRPVAGGSDSLLNPVLAHTADSLPESQPRGGGREPSGGQDQQLTPSLIINATGAWGDWTLKELPLSAPQLLGGTKGSHLFTRHAALTAALGGDAVYAEASDGRLVFLIPLEGGVMIGTTDERFTERPEAATSTELEMMYLLRLTLELFPQVQLTPADIHATYAGIRPLPYSDSSKTASISRDHHVDQREIEGMPVLTLVGGKLTTCRALGEEVADQVLKQLGKPRTLSTRDRPVPGAEDYPQDRVAVDQAIAALAESTGHSLDSCRAVWRLLGTRAKDALRRCDPDGPLIEGTALPRQFVRELILAEWVTTLEDLVERRLLLALEPQILHATLLDLAQLLNQARPCKTSIENMVERTTLRLRSDYGRRDV